MAETVTTPVSTQVPVATPKTAPAPSTPKDETIGTVATTTGAPIKGNPKPEQGKKLYIIA